VASVLMRHRQARIVHVDDTLNVGAPPRWLRRVLRQSPLRMQPLLSRALRPEAGAADAYAAWARGLASRWADVRVVCAAHSAVRELPPGGFAQEVDAALAKVSRALERHRARYGSTCYPDPMRVPQRVRPIPQSSGDPMHPHLLAPLKTGSLMLPNRVFMAPLTRSRAGQPGDVPTAMNAEYYAQRADAGLIVSEATPISPQGQGYAWTPGIHTDAQEAGWKLVTDAVHAQGGRIAAQLWHVGRISHPLVQPDGADPVAPSAIVAKGANCFVVQPDGTPGNVPSAMPRAL